MEMDKQKIIATQIVTRTSPKSLKKWVFAFEIKSYAIKCLCYGEYVGDKTTAFYHPWQVDRYAEKALTADETMNLIPQDVWQEAKESLVQKLKIDNVNASDIVKGKMLENFNKVLIMKVAESPSKPLQKKKPQKA